MIRNVSISVFFYSIHGTEDGIYNRITLRRRRYICSRMSKYYLCFRKSDSFNSQSTGSRNLNCLKERTKVIVLRPLASSN